MKETVSFKSKSDDNHHYLISSTLHAQRHRQNGLFDRKLSNKITNCVAMISQEFKMKKVAMSFFIPRERIWTKMHC